MGVAAVAGIAKAVAAIFAALNRAESANNTVGTVDTAKSIMYYLPKPPTIATTKAKQQLANCLQAIVEQHAVSFTVVMLLAVTSPSDYRQPRTD